MSNHVDGHDFGSDEFNIFILTNDPKMAFDMVDRIRHEDLPDYNAVAAYRELSGEDYVVLWPVGYEGFDIA